MNCKKAQKEKIKFALGHIPGHRTSLSERPTIPCKKVMLSNKDKSLSRASRKKAIRDAHNEY